ncbi:MAG TPA: GntR family transcriptional regulator, partial [Solirubrobacteraceae bacterium]|nr:GntR family transcriptional regulator [Solirubrobacteraceae bacterium]
MAAEGVVARPSLVDGAESALRNWLSPGRYRQGDRLPPEHEVAAMLGVSRGTLRSALHRLERSGEIVRRQGSGTFVGRMGFPAAFGERLERLEPYSSVARRRGLTLTAVDLEIAERVVEQEAAEALGLPAGARTMTITRTIVTGGSAVATMYDVVHPDVQLPESSLLRAALQAGQMVLDVLIEAGVPITFARTRVMPALVSGRERAGRRLGIQ